MTPSEVLATAVAESLAQIVEENEDIWSLVDKEIYRQLEATEVDAAQIRLNSENGGSVAVTIFGADEPLVVPFFVPEPITTEEIRAVRGFADKLHTMADAAQAKLNASKP